MNYKEILDINLSTNDQMLNDFFRVGFFVNLGLVFGVLAFEAGNYFGRFIPGNE